MNEFVLLYSLTLSLLLPSLGNNNDDSNSSNNIDPFVCTSVMKVVPLLNAPLHIIDHGSVLYLVLQILLCNQQYDALPFFLLLVLIIQNEHNLMILLMQQQLTTKQLLLL